MKKLLLALSLGSALVCGSAMAHDATFSAVPVLMQDKVDFIGFNSQQAADNFVKIHHLSATVIHKMSNSDYHIMLADIKQSS